MNIQPDKLRTYDLTTAPGVISAFSQVAGAVALFVWSLAGLESGLTIYHVIGAAVGVILLVGFIAPAWVSWVWKIANDRRGEELRNAATNEHTVALELEIKLEKARQDTLRTLAQLNPEQIKYAREMAIGASIEIAAGNVGPVIDWVLQGVHIPLWFTRTWWEAYQARGEDELPPDHDFNNAPQRDQARLWASAIIDALSRIGAAIPARGQVAPRWVLKDAALRQAALYRIGFYTALQIAGYKAEEE